MILSSYRCFLDTELYREHLWFMMKFTTTIFPWHSLAFLCFIFIFIHCFISGISFILFVFLLHAFGMAFLLLHFCWDGAGFG